MQDAAETHQLDPQQSRPPPPRTLAHPAQVSFIFILLYSCFSGRCGTRTDIRLTNNAATAAKSGATPSPCSPVSLSSLSLFLYLSTSLSASLSLCVPGQIDVRQPTLEIALRGHCSHGRRCCARNRRSATAPREYKMLALAGFEWIRYRFQRGIIIHAWNVLEELANKEKIIKIELGLNKLKTSL